jgi:hypothetical protein
MKRRGLYTVLALAPWTLALAMAAVVAPRATVSDMQRLLGFMTGSFSSEEQARSDADFYDIRLQMVRVWPGHPDGYWLYVEQAAAESLDRPYRQRVYNLRQLDDDTIESRVYLLPDPLSCVGEWKKEIPLEPLLPEALVWKKGCSILIKKRNTKVFYGSTVARECASDLRGAAYATSEVEITAEALISWDRGYAADGRQVWGAVKSGYIFKKLKPVAIKN